MKNHTDVLIIGVGLLLFYKNGATKLNATIFYSFSCVIFLMILELIKNIVHPKKQENNEK